MGNRTNAGSLTTSTTEQVPVWFLIPTDAVNEHFLATLEFMQLYFPFVIEQCELGTGSC